LENSLLTDIELNKQIAVDFGRMSDDPLRFVMYSFPWGSGELAEFPDGPDVWQKEILQQVSQGVLTATEAIRIAVASGNGVGKSGLAAWLILWALATFEDTKGVITSNTETQLKIKSWAELSKWYNMFIGRHLFTLTATSIFSNQPGHEKTWRIDQVPWNETRPEAFAGLHNKGKRILIIFDESSAIPDIIWETTEGALTDEDTQIIWCVFGNPTRNEGKFHGCFNLSRKRWFTKQIDSRTSKLTNKREIQQWIDDYGIESDFVKVHVLGEFPNVSDRQFIPQSYVNKARGKHIPEKDYNFAPKVIAVEPAWTGGDEIVIGLRQGNVFRILAKYARNDDDFQMAGYIAKFEDQEQADAVFIDFGYGTGIYSAGKQQNRRWILVPFGAASADVGYVNKRAEMWGSAKKWLDEGGCIPDDPVLCAQLTGPEYYIKATGPHAGKIILEAKEDMKTRGLESPNRADCLALTFAFPVVPKNQWKNQRIDQDTVVINRGNVEFVAGQNDYSPI